MKMETIFIVITTQTEEKRLYDTAKKFNIKVRLVGGDFAISGTKSELYKFQCAWYG
jgi:hypothetical protein